MSSMDSALVLMLLLSSTNNDPFAESCSGSLTAADEQEELPFIVCQSPIRRDPTRTKMKAIPSRILLSNLAALVPSLLIQ